MFGRESLRVRRYLGGILGATIRTGLTMRAYEFILTTYILLYLPTPMLCKISHAFLRGYQVSYIAIMRECSY